VSYLRKLLVLTAVALTMIAALLASSSSPTDSAGDRPSPDQLAGLQDEDDCTIATLAARCTP
jgi:hypothetical protein